MEDPVLFCRNILPHWFTKPIPWVHRGILAILTRRADFLLNFGEEVWPETTSRWTKKHLAKIVRNFTYPVDPSRIDSPRKPMFIIRYKEDGRTPLSIDIVLSRYSNIIAPRGISKTTITNAAVLFLCLMEEVKHFVYTSDTEGHAGDQLETIKQEIESNEQINALWGDLAPDRMDPERWNSTEIELKNGVKGTIKGRGSQFRGLNKKTIRPDLIILDDVEDDESVATEEQRTKTKKWRMRVVEPALPKIVGEGRIISLGTVIHPQCLVLDLEKDPRYTSVRFGAEIRDENNQREALWNDYMTLKEIDAEREAFARVGQLFEFGLEYLSTVNLEEKSYFKAENVQRYRTLSPEEFTTQYPIRALCIDPAISESVSAAFCSLAVVGMSEKGFFHIPELIMRIGMTPEEQVEEYFRLSQTWKCNRHGVESIAYQTALVHLLREQMFRRQHYFEIDEKVGGRMSGNLKKKHIRVEGIVQPRYAAKLITHNTQWPDYEGQLFNWPHGKKDGPDVIAMCIALCDPFAGLALPSTFDKDGNELPPEILSEATMEPLNDLPYSNQYTQVP